MHPLAAHLGELVCRAWFLAAQMRAINAIFLATKSDGCRQASLETEIQPGLSPHMQVTDPYLPAPVMQMPAVDRLTGRIPELPKE